MITVHVDRGHGAIFALYTYVVGMIGVRVTFFVAANATTFKKSHIFLTFPWQTEHGFFIGPGLSSISPESRKENLANES